MQKISKQTKNVNSEEFNLHFRQMQVQSGPAYTQTPPHKQSSDDKVVKYRRGSWTRSPPDYIKGQNGPVKVTGCCMLSTNTNISTPQAPHNKI